MYFIYDQFYKNYQGKSKLLNDFLKHTNKNIVYITNNY